MSKKTQAQRKPSKKAQDKILSFALTELEKVVKDLEEGKIPQMSPKLQKLNEELTDIDEDSVEDMDDKAVEKWASEVLKKMGKKNE